MKEENSNGMPLLGDKVPEFEAQTTHGKLKFPGDYKGNWVVLFSHPADYTPVCTTEFVAFQKRIQEFGKIGCEIVGLSIDQVFSHLKWIEWIKDKLGIGIEFPVIADDRGKIAELMGMVHPGKGTNTVRAVLIVDPRGVLRAMLYYPQELGRNMDEILRMVKGLQTVDREKVAMPANWPKNELVADHVIVPPAKSTEMIKKRNEQLKGKEIECFDWWLCHKKLGKD